MQAGTAADKAALGAGFEDRFKNMTHEEVVAFLEHIEAVAMPADAQTVRTMAATIRCLTEALQSKGISRLLAESCG